MNNHVNGTLTAMNNHVNGTLTAMNNHVNGTLTAMRAAAPPSPRFSQEGPGSGGPYPTSTPSPVHSPRLASRSREASRERWRWPGGGARAQPRGQAHYIARSCSSLLSFIFGACALTCAWRWQARALSVSTRSLPQARKLTGACARAYI